MLDGSAKTGTPTVKLLNSSDLSLLSPPSHKPLLLDPRQYLLFYSCSFRRIPQSATVMSKADATKRQRASQACNFCHARGLRCRRGATGEDDHQAIENTGCLTCKDYGVDCKMERPVKKRGRRAQVISPEENEVDTTRHLHAMSLQTIHRLVRIYRDTMYQC